MKRNLFPFLMFVLLLGVNQTFAQQAKIITGTFKAPIPTRLDTKQADVNYTMTLSAAKDKLDIVSNSTDKTFFSVDVLSADNKVLLHWAPDAPVANCSHSFDVSGLTPGSYHVSMNNHHLYANSSNANGKTNGKTNFSKSFHDVSFTK